MISPKFRNLLVLFFILAIVVFAFWPSLDSGFVYWDDDVHLYENISIRSLDAEHIGDIFKSTVNKLYIPLTSLSFAFEYHFFGYDPFVYHLNNLILHLMVVGLIFWLGLRLGLSVLASAVAACLFGIHPMHVESVAWVTERKDVLYSLFYMAALLSYTWYLRFTQSTSSLVYKKQYRYLILTMFFGILSMLAKPMALSLPLILLLFDWFHGRKITREIFVEKIPIVLIIGAITWASYVAHARIPGKGILEGALTWSWTFVFYIKQFLFPIILVPVYQLPKPLALTNPEYILSILVLAALIFCVFRFRKYRWFIFAIAYYVFSIFFLLRFDESKDINIVADRFMYLPSLGICFLVGLAVQKLWNQTRKIHKYPAMILVVALVVTLSIKTYNQCLIWKDSITLWQHQLKFYPNQPVALNNLAAALREEEEVKIAEEYYRKVLAMQKADPTKELSLEAIKNMKKVDFVMALYAKAIASKPNFVDSYYNLGRMLSELNRIPEAVETFKKALELDHKYKDVHFSLGELYQEIGDYEQAVFAFEQTIQLNPENEDIYVEVISAFNRELSKNPKNVRYIESRNKAMEGFRQLIESRLPKPVSYFNLGYLYGDIGDFPSAEAAYQMVLDINPNHSNTIYNLGNIYRDQGRITDALAMYKKAAKSGSKKSDAYLNMGTIYERQGKQKQARESFEMAIAADSHNAIAYFNLGFIEERSGDYLSAVDLYTKSINLDSSNHKAHYNLGNTYARLGRNQLAIESYLKAIDVNPDYMDAWVNLSTLSFREGDYAGAVKYYDEAALLGYIAPAGYLKALAPHRASKYLAF